MSISDAEVSVQVFALAVYRYCRAASGSVTSWIRTTRHNVSVGGVPSSFHLTGLGCDVVLDSPSVLDSDARHVLASNLGLRLVVESDHDHLQLMR